MMIELSRNRLAVYLVLAAVAGWCIGGMFTPTNEPRPAVRLFQKLLKWGALLWLLGDEPPPANAVHCHIHDPIDEHNTRTGSDGFPLVDHRRAF